MSIAFTFPGQGSQKPGMGRPWVDHESWELVQEASEAAGRDVTREKFVQAAEAIGKYQGDTMQVSLSANIANCTTGEYGDPFSVMGSASHYEHTAFARGKYSWLAGANTATATTSGDYQIGPLATQSATAVTNLNPAIDIDTYVLALAYASLIHIKDVARGPSSAPRRLRDKATRGAIRKG